MKKIFLTIFFCSIVLLSITGCGLNDEQSSSNKNNDFTVDTDIKIEDIDWKFGSGTLEGQNYVLLQYTNNSEYIIDSFKLKFTEKDSVKEEEKEAYYDDIQASQGFDDEYMNKLKETDKKLNDPITMYCNYTDTVNLGETSEKIKCYYEGGWSSKNVLHSDLVIPEIAEIEYIKDDVQYIIYYNFESKSYDVEKNK